MTNLITKVDTTNLSIGRSGRSDLRHGSRHTPCTVHLRDIYGTRVCLLLCKDAILTISPTRQLKIDKTK